MTQDFTNVPMTGTASGGRSTNVLNPRPSLANLSKPKGHVKARFAPYTRRVLGKLLLLAMEAGREADFHKAFDKYGKPIVRVRAVHGGR